MRLSAAAVTTTYNNHSATVVQMADARRPRKQLNDGAVAVFNEIFKQFRVIFPALTVSVKSQSDLDALRAQWVMAFLENGITSLEQVEAGMSAARRQNSPYLPSPGQFISWCRLGEFQSAGLPDSNELYNMLMKYCAERSLYDSPEEYPWPSNAAYWMITKLYDVMRSQGLSESEMRKRCSTELSDMASRIRAGEEIPKPIKQVAKLYIPVTKEAGMAKIAEIKRRFFRSRV